ncbi:Stk1 family PASTA domain-containing Ser/Thr kinase [Peptoniphilus sp. BV3AC2]|uniref:Stk1 family PASTA domain-containing Ser/Thr kinase n=1 Tax=Peptoniphilus sp. BV3AC2 TaxID=1111133 RepID=UPI0003B8603D|nr:Stk1 family PASTA domain-containing Ser/Thr kinase [Peptoniphilus sp. BV3AC2]ERT63506.1 putative serine/threonine-protein kinase PrkC [Peptoniphilus sp. BV3AC2]
MIGKVLGTRYEILEKIGTGGMGDVYKAHDRRLDRIVAIKILKAQYNDETGFIKKFKRESLAAASISHPSIVSIYDVGTEDLAGLKVHYIVMEYIEGRTLKEVIKEEGRIPEKRALNYAIQILDALKVAHSKGIVHRDIKSPNIMITHDDRVKVTDFGIARIADNTTVTATNAIMGSVHYFSPEQARGVKVDNRSDIYSLGIVLYEMLTGKLPFDAENPVSVALMQVQSKMPKPSDTYSDISEDADILVEKLTMKNPDDRFKDASAAIKAIKGILLGRGISITEKEVDPPVSRNKKVIRRDDSDHSPYSNIALNNEENFKKKRQKPKKNSTGPLLLGVLAALLTVALLVFIVPKVMSSRSDDKPKVQEPEVTEFEAPDLLGKSEAEVRSILKTLGLKLEIEYDEEDNRPNGVVLSQEPVMGTMIKTGDTIKVFLNKLDEVVTIPNVINRTRAEAEDLFTSSSINIGEVKEEYSNEIEAGKIISTEPKAGFEIKRGQSVDLVISKGIDNNPVNAINFRGEKLTVAQKYLEDSGLKVEVEYQESNEVGKDEVVRQDPIGEVAKNSTVHLIVSSGPVTQSTEPSENESDSSEVSQVFKTKVNDDGQRHRVVVTRYRDGESMVFYDYHKTFEDGDISIEIKGKSGDKFVLSIDGEEVDTTVLK